jgi:CspA family cold shock protein
VASGTVKWWSVDRGCGFVSVDGHPDVFVHHAALPDGTVDLRAGQSLEFEITPGTVGLVATDVVLS